MKILSLKNKSSTIAIVKTIRHKALMTKELLIVIGKQQHVEKLARPTKRWIRRTKKQRSCLRFRRWLIIKVIRANRKVVLDNRYKKWSRFIKQLTNNNRNARRSDKLYVVRRIIRVCLRGIARGRAFARRNWDRLWSKIQIQKDKEAEITELLMKVRIKATKGFR